MLDLVTQRAATMKAKKSRQSEGLVHFLFY